MRKLRFILLISLYCIGFCALFAQKPIDVLNNTISAYNKLGGVSANYTVTSSQGSTIGKIVLKGNKFRIISDDLKCWFDGKNQWAYSPMTGEVNLTNPTAEEMVTSNPYVALSTFKKTCKVTKAPKQTSGSYTMKLVPNSKNSDIKQVLITVLNKSYSINNVVFEMKDGQKITTKITNYKATKVNNGTFVFDKKMVPTGTEVVDLR